MLKVYNHVTGKVTYVYPIWLEKKSIIDSYTKVTLEDGTVIKFTKGKKRYSRREYFFGPKFLEKKDKLFLQLKKIVKYLKIYNS